MGGCLAATGELEWGDGGMCHSTRQDVSSRRPLSSLLMLLSRRGVLCRPEYRSKVACRSALLEVYGTDFQDVYGTHQHLSLLRHSGPFRSKSFQLNPILWLCLPVADPSFSGPGTLCLTH